MTKCRQYNAGQSHFLGEFFLATDVFNDDQTIPDNSRQFQTIPDNPRQFHFLGEFSLATDVGNDDQERGGGVLRRDGPRLRRQVYIVVFFCSNQGN